MEGEFATVPLAKVASFRNGLNFTSEGACPPVRYVGVGDFQQKAVVASVGDLAHAQPDRPLLADDYLRRGDLLFVRSNGNKALVGRCVEIDLPEGENAAFSGFTIRARIDSAEVDRRFIAHAVRSTLFKEHLHARSAGGNISNLSQDVLSSFPIPYPSLPEQRRIAVVLDAWDEAIALNERLVAAKRRRRDGVRVELIGTGGLRPLPDLADIRFSGVDKKVDPQERPVRLCNYMDVFGNEQITDTISFSNGSATENEHARFALLPGDVLFTKDSETPEDIAVCAAVVSAGPDLVCGYHLGIARPDKGQVVGAYLAHAMRTPFVRSQFVNRVNGVTRFGLTLEAVASIKVPAPSVERQQSVADLLDVLTDEIDLLAARTDLLRTQKRGLMQRLLTGAVRVPESIDALMPADPPREAAE